jgi:hypothetical protein
VGGALNAAWTVASHQTLLTVAPATNRSFYVSAHNLTNGLLMAGGPLLGGLLADHVPVVGLTLPGGARCCYFHVLLVLAGLGGAAALCLLARVPVPEPGRRAAPARVVWGRVRLARAWTALAARASNSSSADTARQRSSPCPNRS